MQYFSACGTRFGILEFSVIYFLRVEHALVLWNFVLHYPVCGMCSGIVQLRVHFFACGRRSSIVELRVIFFCVWNALWYCGILCYIFPRVEPALELWNFLLCFSKCGTRSGIVEFFVIFFCVLNALWFCGI